MCVQCILYNVHATTTVAILCTIVLISTPETFGGQSKSKALENFEYMICVRENHKVAVIPFLRLLLLLLCMCDKIAKSTEFIRVFQLRLLVSHTQAHIK